MIPRCIHDIINFQVKKKKNKKTIILLIAVAVVTCALTFNACKKKAGHEDLNILLITLDTTRADHIGAYGHDTVKTPNIDTLCRSGVMFQNCYSPVPLTLPAHCTILTGKYSIGHNVRNNGRYFLNKEEPVMTELLKKKGYHTHAVMAAVEQYNSLLDKEILSRNDGFLYKVAMLNGQAGKMAMAEKIFRMILRVKPHGKYYYYYAMILSRNRKFREAVKSMETALSRYPADLTAAQTTKALSVLGAWKGNF